MSAHTLPSIDVPTLIETYDAMAARRAQAEAPRREIADRLPYGHEISVAILFLGAMVASYFDTRVAMISLALILAGLVLGRGLLDIHKRLHAGPTGTALPA